MESLNSKKSYHFAALPLFASTVLYYCIAKKTLSKTDLKIQTCVVGASALFELLLLAKAPNKYLVAITPFLAIGSASYFGKLSRKTALLSTLILGTAQALIGCLFLRKPKEKPPQRDEEGTVSETLQEPRASTPPPLQQGEEAEAVSSESAPGSEEIFEVEEAAVAASSRSEVAPNIFEHVQDKELKDFFQNTLFRDWNFECVEGTTYKSNSCFSRIGTVTHVGKGGWGDMQNSFLLADKEVEFFVGSNGVQINNGLRLGIHIQDYEKILEKLGLEGRKRLAASSALQLGGYMPIWGTGGCPLQIVIFIKSMVFHEGEVWVLGQIPEFQGTLEFPSEGSPVNETILSKIRGKLRTITFSKEEFFATFAGLKWQ